MKNIRIIYEYRVINGTELIDNINDRYDDTFYNKSGKKSPEEYRDLIRKSQKYFEAIKNGSIEINESKYFIVGSQKYLDYGIANHIDCLVEEGEEEYVQAHAVYVDNPVWVKECGDKYVYQGTNGQHRYVAAVETGLDILVKVERELISYRVLYLVHDNKKGGAAQSFLDMVKYVSGQHEVYVLTPHKRGYVPSELDKLGIWHKNAHYFWWEIAKIGNPFVDTVRFLAYKFLNAYNYIEARRIAKLVKRMDIDIIHSNSSTINIGAIVSEMTGIPHVWHLRELALPEYPLYPMINGDSLKRILNQGKTSYIAISEYAKKFYSEFINDTDRISVVYNGISSLYNYHKTASEYNSDVVVFLISGNYCEEKGQIDVVHAAGLLVSQGITDFKIYMAGRGDFAKVKRYIAQYDALDPDVKGKEDVAVKVEDNTDSDRPLGGSVLADHIVFCGLVDDMLSLRKKCDVEIVASRTEAFGRVTVEAMRASNPVIGSATGGTTELIQDGMTGFLYAYKDDAALAACMKRFIDRSELAYEMGQRAYEWSVDKFTSEENVKGVRSVYEDALLGR